MKQWILAVLVLGVVACEAGGPETPMTGSTEQTILNPVGFKTVQELCPQHQISGDANWSQTFSCGRGEIQVDFAGRLMAVTETSPTFEERFQYWPNGQVAVHNTAVMPGWEDATSECFDGNGMPSSCLSVLRVLAGAQIAAGQISGE